MSAALREMVIAMNAAMEMIGQELVAFDNGSRVTISASGPIRIELHRALTEAGLPVNPLPAVGHNPRQLTMPEAITKGKVR